MTSGIIQTLSYSFAKDIVGLYSQIVSIEKEFVISKQILKSGTSITANIVEAQSATSKKEFTYKLSIGLREARETLFWIQLINDTNLYLNLTIGGYENDCNKIIGLVRIIKKSKHD